MIKSSKKEVNLQIFDTIKNYTSVSKEGINIFKYFPCIFYREKNELFHDEDPYHIETSPLTCSVNEWTDFYMTRASDIKELRENIASIMRVLG